MAFAHSCKRCGGRMIRVLSGSPDADHDYCEYCGWWLGIDAVMAEAEVRANAAGFKWSVASSCYIPLR